MTRAAVDRAALLTVVSALVLGLALVWTVTRPPVAVSERTDELNAALDRGVGLMGQFDFVGAAKAFAEAQVLAPDDRLATLNLAIAMLNGSDDDSQARARAMLVLLAGGEAAPGTDANDAAGSDGDIAIRAAYCIGLIDLFLGEPESARATLQRVAGQRPDDAFASFYLGQSFEMLGDMEQALPHYARAVELDPLLRSGVLGLSRCFMRGGNMEEGERMLARFEELAADPRAHLAEFKYTRMGPLAMALLAREAIMVVKPAGDPFLPPVPLSDESGVVDGTLFSQTLAIDLNGDQWTDLLVIPRPVSPTGDPPRPARVLLGSSTGLSVASTDNTAVSGLSELSGVAAAGDLDGDGTTEILTLSTGISQIARQASDRSWSVDGFGGGVVVPEADVLDLKFADLDADADLDAVVATDAEWSIWINTGNATFQPLEEARGAEPASPGSFAPRDLRTRGRGRAESTTLADIDQDGDIDLILNAAAGPSELWLNEGLWSWRRDDSWKHGQVATTFVHPDSGATCVVVQHGRQRHGHCKVYELAGTPGWRAGGEPDRLLLDARGHTLDTAVIDVAGTGRPSIISTQMEREIVTRVWSLEGALLQEFEGFSLLNVLVDRDDRGPTLLGALHKDQGGATIPNALALCAPGPGRLPFASFTLSGRVDPSQSMRSNASGVGTSYAIRNGAAWAQGSVLPHSSAGAQGVQPEAVGLAGRPAADFMRLEWPDALLQTELDLKPGHSMIVEMQRQVSSCPVIFGWDGDEFQFVTDCLGVGGIGYLASVERTAQGLVPQYAVPTPRESVLLPAAAVVPRDGVIELRLGEPMEESCYLDAARLVAYDLPSGWDMTVDERLAILGPPATGKPIFWRDESIARVVSASVAGCGDATTALAQADGTAAVGPVEHPRHIGLLSSPLVLTLVFDRPIHQLTGDPVLLMEGWVEYPYCQTNFAMWQEGISPKAPTFDALDPATGDWVTLQEQYGYPAGMPRLAAFPLDREKLPMGCTTLRLTTTVELYIDRIRCVGAELCTNARVQECPFLGASAAECGFPLRSTLPQKRPHYDYSRRAPLWDTRTQVGFLTAFGNCAPLLVDVDDACAMFGPGEEIRLRFTPPAEPIPGSETTRHWILQLNGWCKDMDRYTGSGATIDPLPTRDGSAPSETARSLHDRFNTRRTGNGSASN